LRHESLANDEVEQSMEKGPKEVVVEQNRVEGEKIEIRAKAGASSQQQPNWTIRYGKLDHPVLTGLR
jgi:hypothetical protein